MILHWLTTGWRSLVSNPLFSLITIISLSIGCCGALLVGANIKQHLSFDRWTPHADRIAVMFKGEIVEIGEAETIYQHPHHEYSRTLLAAVPRPDPSRSRRRRGTVDRPAT